MIDLAFIKKEAERLDPQVDRRSLTFKAAVCLLSGLQVGADAKKVAAFTGYPLKTVSAFAKRLEDSGVWKDGKTCCEWFEGDHGGIAFWLDVSVAMGMIERKAA